MPGTTGFVIFLPRFIGWFVFWIFLNFEFSSISRFYIPISQQQLQLEAYDPSQEKSYYLPYPTVASISAYLSQRLTGWVKKLVAQYQFAHYGSSQLPFLFVLSVVKCGRICRAQTCAHYGTEPSRLAKQFPHGGSITSINLHFFSNISSLMSPICQQPLKIEPYKQRTYLFYRPCAPLKTPWNLCPWKSYVECEWLVCVSSTDALVLNFLQFWIFIHFIFSLWVTRGGNRPSALPLPPVTHTTSFSCKS